MIPENGLRARTSGQHNQLSDLAAEGLAMIPALSLDGRRFLDGKRAYIDYCTTNYLGFDFRPEMHEKAARFTQSWGTLTGWSRLEADPVIYTDLEKRVCDFVGAGDCILSHTITITNFSLIPAIAKKGLIVCDSKVHTVVWEACRLARDHGARLERFAHQDMADLERILASNRAPGPVLVAVDGVYSISTEYAPIREMQALCEKYGAWLYVDDAHGFGVLGASPSKASPYGFDGAGVLAHYGGDHERTFYVSSFGKAFCTHTAFATVPRQYHESLRERCMQYIYSAPMSPYLIGLCQAALDLNENEGDRARSELLANTRYFIEGLRRLGLRYLNNSYFPVVFWEIGSLDTLIAVAKEMYSSGVIAGLRAYPVVPADGCGMRFGLTRLHTREQLDETLGQIERVARKFGLAAREA